KLSKQDFGKEPVIGVGSTTWQLMFEAARKFSEQEAFPELKFEQSFKNGKCVLCHQDLSEVAASRLARFDAFIRNDIAAIAQTKKEALERRSKMIDQLDISTAEKFS